MSVERIEDVKVVYRDEDYTKVVYGNCEIGETLVKVIDNFGKQILIGKQFIVSIIPRR